MANETDMTRLDQRVFKMAAMLDTSIRFHSDNIETDEMENNYLDIWLKNLIQDSNYFACLFHHKFHLIKRHCLTDMSLFPLPMAAKYYLSF